MVAGRGPDLHVISRVLATQRVRPEPASRVIVDWLPVLAVLALLTALRCWAAAHAGLAPDEAYYWLWSRVPSTGYYDHPPMVAWWIWASTSLIGNTPLAIRTPTILSALVTSLALAATAEMLFADRRIAVRAVLWFNSMILIGVGAILSTPDAPSVMFWALATWALAALRRTGLGPFWLAVGLSAGLGCASKYTDFFLGLGILAWLVADPDARRWFRSPWLWAGRLVAFVALLPVFIWNGEHHWVSFAKQFGRISAGQPTLRYVGEFVASQLGLLNPIIAIFAILAIPSAVRSRTARRLGATGFLLALTMPLALYMVIHAFHGRVQGNWLAPIYPALALLAASATETARAGSAGSPPSPRRWVSRCPPSSSAISQSRSPCRYRFAIRPSGSSAGENSPRPSRDCARRPALAGSPRPAMALRANSPSMAGATHPSRRLSNASAIRLWHPIHGLPRRRHSSWCARGTAPRADSTAVSRPSSRSRRCGGRALVTRLSVMPLCSRRAPPLIS